MHRRAHAPTSRYPWQDPKYVFVCVECKWYVHGDRNWVNRTYPWVHVSFKAGSIPAKSGPRSSLGSRLRRRKRHRAPEPREFLEPGFRYFSAHSLWKLCRELRRFAETVIFHGNISMYSRDLRRQQICAQTAQSVKILARGIPYRSPSPRSRAADLVRRADRVSSRRGKTDEREVNGELEQCNVVRRGNL